VPAWSDVSDQREMGREEYVSAHIKSSHFDFEDGYSYGDM
jgi:hypothetical protein